MSRPELRAVLFDAGNTLAHLDYAFIAGVLAAHGHPRTPLEIRIAEYSAKVAIDQHLLAHSRAAGDVEGLLWRAAQRERPAYFGTLLQTLGVADSAAQPILAALQAHNQEECLWRVVEPDTADVLTALRARGLALAVISNADGRIEADLERYGLRQHFATVVDSHIVGVEKPHPGIFNIALQRLQVAPATALYVGDEFSIDILGARAAGLAAVLVDTLGRYPGNLDCRRISRIAELLDLVP
jgi:HAD superfamily hydrolase (TIGR01509 family)